MRYVMGKNGHLVPGRGRPRRTAKSGPIKSVNAGVGASQVNEANKLMADAGLDVKFDGDGNMHSPDRRTHLKALKYRGLHSNTDSL